MRVAVVGASRDRRKFGNKAVRAFASAGHTVYPVNPDAESVEGLRAYASVLDVPGPIDMATVYVQPEVAIGLLDDFAQKAIPEIWFNPGSDSDELMSETRRHKLNAVYACSIAGIGQDPGKY